MHILPTIRLVIYIFTSFASILCIFERKIGDIWRKRVIPIIYLKYVLRSYAIKYVELRAYTIYRVFNLKSYAIYRVSKLKYESVRIDFKAVIFIRANPDKKETTDRSG